MQIGYIYEKFEGEEDNYKKQELYKKLTINEFGKIIKYYNIKQEELQK